MSNRCPLGRVQGGVLALGLHARLRSLLLATAFVLTAEMVLGTHEAHLASGALSTCNP